jgi:hypothetical protein
MKKREILELEGLVAGQLKKVAVGLEKEPPYVREREIEKLNAVSAALTAIKATDHQGF